MAWVDSPDLRRKGAWQARGLELTGALPAVGKTMPATLFMRSISEAETQAGMRRGAGVVERGGLENRCALTSTEGSNPSLSAIGLFTLANL